MHSFAYLTTFAAAATTVLARPAPFVDEAASAVDEYAATASATISDYIETGIGSVVESNKDYANNDPYGRPGRGGPGRPGHWSNDTTSNQGLADLQEGQTACMTREEAIKVAGTFQSIIQGYTVEQALAALTPDFVDYSSAVSIIINKGGSGPEDVTAPIFTTRDEFMQGHGKQEPIPFETLKVWGTCDGVVSMVWRTIRSGQGQQNETAAIPVTGTAVLETEPASLSTGVELERAQAGGYTYRIHTLWSEFNTAAWLVNNGVLKTGPGVPNTPIPEGEVTPSPPSDITKRAAGEELTKFNVGLA